MASPNSSKTTINTTTSSPHEEQRKLCVNGEEIELMTIEQKSLLWLYYDNLEFGDDVILKCIICHKVPIFHYTTTYGHLICKNCLNDAFKNKGYCPELQTTFQDIPEQDWNTEIKLHSIIASCPNRIHGCKVKSKLGDLSKHILKCIKETDEEADDFVIVENTELPLNAKENLKNEPWEKIQICCNETNDYCNTNSEPVELLHVSENSKDIILACLNEVEETSSCFKYQHDDDDDTLHPSAQQLKLTNLSELPKVLIEEQLDWQDDHFELEEKVDKCTHRSITDDKRQLLSEQVELNKPTEELSESIKPSIEDKLVEYIDDHHEELMKIDAKLHGMGEQVQDITTLKKLLKDILIKLHGNATNQGYMFEAIETKLLELHKCVDIPNQEKETVNENYIQNFNFNLSSRKLIMTIKRINNVLDKLKPYLQQEFRTCLISLMVMLNKIM
ncbi:hypothetical protein CHUAL_001740 [Chamberlinius hualienensis]